MAIKMINFKKIATYCTAIIAVLLISIVISHTNAYASLDNGGSLAQGNYDGGPSDSGSSGSSGGSSNSNSNSSSTGGGQKVIWESKPREVVVKTPEQKDLDLINWNKYYSEADNHSIYAPAGSVVTLESVRAPETQKIWHKTTDFEDNGTKSQIFHWYTLVEIPGIKIDVVNNGITSNDIRKNYRTTKYDWRLKSGDATGIDHGNYWETPDQYSTVKYSKPGDYTISSVPYQIWDVYSRNQYTFTAYWVDSSYNKTETLTTQTHNVDTYLKTDGSEDSSRYKEYTMKIATQDLNQQVEVKSTTTSNQYDVDIRMIQ